MEISKNTKNIILWFSIILIIIFSIFIITGFLDKLSRTDNREKKCIKKEIESIEYNTNTYECFKTKISACKTNI